MYGAPGPPGHDPTLPCSSTRPVRPRPHEAPCCAHAYSYWLLSLRAHNNARGAGAQGSAGPTGPRLSGLINHVLRRRIARAEMFPYNRKKVPVQPQSSEHRKEPNGGWFLHT